MKRYWDIIIGAVVGLVFAIVAKFELEEIQTIYSVIILMLLCIGAFRIIKQTIEKQMHTKNRKPTVIDSMVDGQKAIKAFSLAQEPTKEGEKIGELIILFLRGLKTMFGKLKTFFDKFKGYVLTIALAILTLVEGYGGFINSLFGGVLMINGVAVLPIVTLVCTVIVGIASNGFTKEQMEKIKALFSKSNINEIVRDNIKKTIKEKTATLAQYNKALTLQEHELSNLESELKTLNNAHEAKKEMCAMTPQLATPEDVRLANNAVNECQAKITAKKGEIVNTKRTIDEITTAINALKSQL